MDRRPPDPSKYDMYAAFHTKERAQKRIQQQKNSIYDINRTQKTGKNTSQTASLKNRSGTNAADKPGGIYHVSRTPHPQKQQYTPPKQTISQKNRVQNTGNDSYRYGYHSSYRTTDGRILDGFDKTGRPIYRETSAAGSGAIVKRTAHMPAARLHPVRRIRVETLENTEKKPFPFAIVLGVFFCTVMVMVVLYTYMTLNECTNKLSSLNYRMNTLRKEVNTLSAELVRREDLISIEQTASETLGMVKNDVLTKRYVSIENEDKTELVAMAAEQKRARVTVEIDLDTGRPVGADTTQPTEEKRSE